MSIDAVTIVGAGRVGTAFARSLRARGIVVPPIVRRGEPVREELPVLLCVPDREIEPLAATLGPQTVVGHCSASVPLDALGDRPRFNLHPLLPVPGEHAQFAGAVAAIDGSSDEMVELASSLADALEMRAVFVPQHRRALYHAAASMGANYLMTLEWAAERMAAMCGLARTDLLPLVNASVAAWASRGFRDAIVGPVARGDTATVERQRDAVAAHTPELLPLFDALTDATRLALRTTTPP